MTLFWTRMGKNLLEGLVPVLGGERAGVKRPGTTRARQ
jgi:hypothetical protein